MIISHLEDAGEPSGYASISVRCPSCRQQGIFVPFSAKDVQFRVNRESFTLGQRYCPDLNCKTHIFFVWSNNRQTINATYPPEHIDFDASGVPTGVAGALQEAITCHANQCYIAAAIMVRKTLEMLCDAQNAEGTDLKKRIKALEESMLMPKALISGLNNLRLLGNDAAHVDAREYSEIGQQELEIAIAVTKEVLKAVYQYDVLIERLEALKSSSQAEES